MDQTWKSFLDDPGHDDQPLYDDGTNALLLNCDIWDNDDLVPDPDNHADPPEWRMISPPILQPQPERYEHWQPMGAVCDYKEVILFSKTSSEFFSVDTSCDKEVAAVLSKAFVTCMGEYCDPTLPQVLVAVEEKTQYEIMKVTRVQNIKVDSSHAAFKKNYKIENKRTVYHGTKIESAGSICSNGFRGACSNRCKYGKGIYSSSNVWEALAYSEPAHDSTQRFLVSDLLEGPSIVGTFDMTDFGKDSSGKQILTTTDPGGTIFCASYDSQLSANYCVEVRFMSHFQHEDRHQQIIRMYHPHILALVTKGKKPNVLPTPGIFTTLTTTAPPPGRIPPRNITTLQKHRGFKVGDVVKIVDTFVPYLFCKGKVGTLVKLVKEHTLTYFVRLPTQSDSDCVKAVNGRKFLKLCDDPSFLPCKFVHLEHFPLAQGNFPPAPTSAVLGKRSASDQNP